MAEVDESDALPEPVGLDSEEFSEAFKVFSNDDHLLSTTNSILIPFLKSLGLREPQLDMIVRDVKDSTHQGTVTESQLHEIVVQHVPGLNKPWPSDRDVLRAFKVFDSEGLGFIKVTLLKRFLVQAQLEVEDNVLERLIRDNCTIDGDDLINYEDFVHNVMTKFHHS